MGRGRRGARGREPGRRDPDRRTVGDPRRRVPPGHRRSPARVRRGAVAVDERRRARRSSCTRSSITSRPMPKSSSPTMVAEAGQPTMFAEAVQLRSGAVFARDTIDLYLSMPHEDYNPVPVDQLVAGRGRVERPSARAGGCRHRHHAVQRRDPDGVPEADPRADGRQLGDPAAEPAHPDLVAHVRRRRRRRRSPTGCAQRRGRVRRDRCGDAHHRPGDRHGLVHRVDDRGQADPRPGVVDGEARRARARGQVGTDLPARRGRARRDRGDDGRRDDRGSGVRRRHAHGRTPGAEGRCAQRGERCLRVAHRRSTDRTHVDARPRDQRRAT